MKKYLAGIIQLDVQGCKEENIEMVENLIDEAVAKGAKLVALPEMMNIFGDGDTMEKGAEFIPGYTTDRMKAKAIEHNIYLHCGSIIEKRQGEDKPYNTTVLFNPEGEMIGKYSKMHLFDIDVPNGITYKESDSNAAGNEVVVVDTELGKIGLSICYDLRFCEQFRLMALKGADIFINPAAFMLYTGKDHWEPLLRARAIENACYVLAPNQFGVKIDGTISVYGKSLAVDPWGNVITKASDKNCVILAEIDLDLIQKNRDNVGTLSNRRDDIYTTIERGERNDK